jgi:hypothetical protein
MGTAWSSSHGKIIIEALERLGGTVERSNGTCTSALVEATGLAPLQVTTSLKRLGTAGKVERLIKGKRTYAVVLVGYVPPEPVVEPEPVETAAHNGAGAPQTDDVDVSAEERPGETPSVNYDELAHRLLARVMKIVANPDEVKVRLAETLEENQRWRRKNAELEAERDQAQANYRRVARERDGLRERVRVLEDNMNAAVKGGTRIVDAEVRKRIDHFMREAPNGSKVPV